MICGSPPVTCNGEFSPVGGLNRSRNGSGEETTASKLGRPPVLLRMSSSPITRPQVTKLPPSSGSSPGSPASTPCRTCDAAATGGNPSTLAAGLMAPFMAAMTPAVAASQAATKTLQIQQQQQLMRLLTSSPRNCPHQQQQQQHDRRHRRHHGRQGQHRRLTPSPPVTLGATLLPSIPEPSAASHSRDQTDGGTALTSTTVVQAVPPKHPDFRRTISLSTSNSGSVSPSPSALPPSARQQKPLIVRHIETQV